MARTFYAAALAELKDITLADMVKVEAFGSDEPYYSTFLGTVMALDPCGRYHNILSENGYTDRCGAFWEALEKAAGRCGGWIENGEGDPCDVFFCLPSEDEEDDD